MSAVAVLLFIALSISLHGIYMAAHFKRISQLNMSVFSSFEVRSRVHCAALTSVGAKKYFAFNYDGNICKPSSTKPRSRYSWSTRRATLCTIYEKSAVSKRRRKMPLSRISATDAPLVRKMVENAALQSLYRLENRLSEMQSVEEQFFLTSEKLRTSESFFGELSIHFNRMVCTAVNGTLLQRYDKLKSSQKQLNLADTYRLELIKRNASTKELANSLYEFCVCYGKITVSERVTRVPKNCGHL